MSIYKGEAAAVLLFCVVLLSLVLMKDPRIDRGGFQEAPPLAPVPLIVIEIRGAVEKEGLFHVQKGSTVKQAIDMARPHETADLSRLVLNKPILRKQTLRIPEKKIGSKRGLKREVATKSEKGLERN